MKLKDMFLAQLEREAAMTRKALERVPDGRGDWKPHEKSMPLGRLATLVSSMPSWIVMVLEQDELDLDPPGGKKYQAQELNTGRALAEAMDEHVVKARAALTKATEEHLMKPWRLLAGGKVLSEDPRYVVISEAVFNHLAHHRGQLSVYLRLNNASVPPIYGPSADEGHW